MEFLINLKVSTDFAYFRLINDLDTSWNLIFLAELFEASNRSSARSRRAMAVAPMFFLLAEGPLFCSFVQQLELWMFKTLEPQERVQNEKKKQNTSRTSETQ